MPSLLFRLRCCLPAAERTLGVFAVLVVFFAVLSTLSPPSRALTVSSSTSFSGEFDRTCAPIFSSSSPPSNPSTTTTTGFPPPSGVNCDADPTICGDYQRCNQATTPNQCENCSGGFPDLNQTRCLDYNDDVSCGGNKVCVTSRHECADSSDYLDSEGLCPTYFDACCELPGFDWFILFPIIGNILFWGALIALVIWCWKSKKYKTCCVCGTKTTVQDSVTITGEGTANLKNIDGEDAVTIGNETGTTTATLLSFEKVTCCSMMNNQKCCYIYGGIVCVCWAWITIQLLMMVGGFHSDATYTLVSNPDEPRVSATSSLRFFTAGYFVHSVVDGISLEERFCSWNQLGTDDCPLFWGITTKHNWYLGLVGFASFCSFVVLAYHIWRTTFKKESLMDHRCVQCGIETLVVLPLFLAVVSAVIISSAVAPEGGARSCGLTSLHDNPSLHDFISKEVCGGNSTSCRVDASAQISAFIAGRDEGTVVDHHGIIIPFIIIFYFISGLFVCFCPGEVETKDDLQVLHQDDSDEEIVQTHTEVIDDAGQGKTVVQQSVYVPPPVVVQGTAPAAQVYVTPGRLTTTTTSSSPPAPQQQHYTQPPQQQQYSQPPRQQYKQPPPQPYSNGPPQNQYQSVPPPQHQYGQSQYTSPQEKGGNYDYQAYQPHSQY